MRRVALRSCLAVVGLGIPALAQSTWPTRYYVIHADVPPDVVREAALRIDRVAEEYHRRTSGFAGGVISERLPFHIFSRQEDYLAAGGSPGSAGQFTGDRLMAVATGGGYTWDTIQHEGFHQFADAVIGGDLPIWVNEGLAEYFAEGVFTGDHFLTGLIPAQRLQRIKVMIERRSYKPFPEIMAMQHHTWNHALAAADRAGENYDQAWSMVHFLGHAADGRFEGPFNEWLSLISRGRDWDQAWKSTFRAADGFEEQWRDYWSGLPKNPTLNLYAGATLGTLTSFLARASSQGQQFGSMTDFYQAVDEKKLRCHADDWLPPGLIVEAAARARDSGHPIEILRVGQATRLTCRLPDGTTLEGHFTLSDRKDADPAQGSRIEKVDVTVKPR